MTELEKDAKNDIGTEMEAMVSEAARIEKIEREAREAKLSADREARTESYSMKVVKVFIVFRLIMSLFALYGMYFGGGPWTEGRVFYFFFGFVNVPWFIGFLIAIFTEKFKRKKRISNFVIISMAILFILTQLIFFLPSIIKPPSGY